MSLRHMLKFLHVSNRVCCNKDITLLSTDMETMFSVVGSKLRLKTTLYQTIIFYKFTVIVQDILNLLRRQFLMSHNYEMTPLKLGKG